MKLVGKYWYENVMIALDKAREEVVRADDQIKKAGGHELEKGDKETGRLAIAYSDKLEGFMFELEKVGDKWQQIREEIDADKPEVQEVVLPTKVRQLKGGYKRRVDKIAPWTNLTVKYDNDELIAEPTAKATFAKALAKFDLAKIAKLGVMLNGEPLLSTDRDVFAKYPQCTAEVKDGWFVSTYCSTATKKRFIQTFAKKFQINAKVDIVPHKMKGKVIQSPIASIPVVEAKPKPKAKNDKDRFVEGVPFKVSQVVCACFPEVFRRGLVSEDEVEFMLDKLSSKKFRTGGNPVLKIDRGNDADRVTIAKTGFRKARFYPASKVSLSVGGKKYYLSCVFCGFGVWGVVDWLESKGITKKQIGELVK